MADASNNVDAKVDELLAAAHTKLSHVPLIHEHLPGDDGNAEQAAEVLYSATDEIAAVHEAINSRFFSGRGQSQQVFRDMTLQALEQRITYLNRLNGASQQSRAPLPDGLHDPQPQIPRPVDSISTQSKAIAAVKTQVESLTKAKDFSKIIASKKPEDVLLFLASLEQALSSAGIGQEHWPLSLPFLSSDQSVSNVLISFVSTVQGINIWPAVKKKIIDEWATYWNPELFYRELHQFKQGDLQFTFFLMQLQMRFRLLHKEFLDEGPEFLLCVLREEILHEVYALNRRREFDSMRHLVQEVQAAISTNRACDGKTSSFVSEASGSASSTGCGYCKNRNYRGWKSHQHSDCRYRNNTKAQPPSDKPSSVASSEGQPPVQSPTSPQPSSLADLICYKCGQKGHAAPKCTNARTDAGRLAQEEANKKKNQQKN